MSLVTVSLTIDTRLLIVGDRVTLVIVIAGKLTKLLLGIWSFIHSF